MKNEPSFQALMEGIPKQGQRQDSLQDQLHDLQAVANRLGMYDAADFIRELCGNRESVCDSDINHIFGMRS